MSKLGTHLDSIVVRTREAVDVLNGQRGRWVDFWALVDICGIAECWDWQGGLSGAYGHFYPAINGENRAPRLSYQFVRGPIPRGMWILHACDRPICVNPRHLRPGSVVDNALDADIARWQRAALAARQSGEATPLRAEVRSMGFKR